MANDSLALETESIQEEEDERPQNDLVAQFVIDGGVVDIRLRFGCHAGADASASRSTYRSACPADCGLCGQSSLG
jgi:hypothetical protein